MFSVFFWLRSMFLRFSLEVFLKVFLIGKSMIGKSTIVHFGNKISISFDSLNYEIDKIIKFFRFNFKTRFF